MTNINPIYSSLAICKYIGVYLNANTEQQIFLLSYVFGTYGNYYLSFVVVSLSRMLAHVWIAGLPNIHISLEGVYACGLSNQIHLHLANAFYIHLKPLQSISVVSQLAFTLGFFMHG